MLLSRKHRFIFIHIYKTAGSSIKAALRPMAADPWQIWASRILRRLGSSALSINPLPAHTKAVDVVEYLGAEEFAKYFSFAIVRNPWDWQVSLYHYMRKEPRHFQHELALAFENFEQYIEWRCSEEPRYQTDFVDSPDGHQLVNYIGKLETLDQDFAHICQRLGLQAYLPRLNVSNTAPWQSFYNTRTRRLVHNAFLPDIERFGYRFEAN
jgi:hypothetical protein